MCCVISEAPEDRHIYSQPHSLDTISPKTLRSDAGRHLIWPNSSRCLLDCVIVIQIAPFACCCFCVITTFKKGPEGFFFFLGSLKATSSLGSDAAPAPVHRHRASLIQSFLRRFHQDGQTAVRHLSFLHRAHQLHRKRQKTYSVWKVNLSSRGRDNYLLPRRQQWKRRPITVTSRTL